MSFGGIECAIRVGTICGKHPKVNGRCLVGKRSRDSCLDPIDQHAGAIFMLGVALQVYIAQAVLAGLMQRQPHQRLLPVHRDLAYAGAGIEPSERQLVLFAWFQCRLTR